MKFSYCLTVPIETDLISVNEMECFQSTVYNRRCENISETLLFWQYKWIRQYNCILQHNWYVKNEIFYEFQRILFLIKISIVLWLCLFNVSIYLWSNLCKQKQFYASFSYYNILLDFNILISNYSKCNRYMDEIKTSYLLSVSPIPICFFNFL